MKNPELIVIVLNVLVLLIAYFIIYPRFCGSNANKVVINDVVASFIVLFISGSIFWGSNEEFSLLFLSVNWFWFTLITYGLIEIPLMIWYYKKNNIRM